MSKFQRLSSYQESENFKEFCKKDILIIEDSENLSNRLISHLKNLGFDNIHVSHTAASGLYSFEEIIKTGKHPIVFLNFLPEADLPSIIKIIHQIQNDTKIILASPHEPTDEIVLEMISRGIYWNIQSPINEENLHEIVKNIFFEEKETKYIPNLEAYLENILRTKIRVTFDEIKEIFFASDKEIGKIIENLIEKQIIVEDDEITIPICKNCSNSNVIFNFSCPKCQKTVFEKGILIEHYECGKISHDIDFVNNRCPQCKKQLKAIGLDYRTYDNFFICNYCNDRFPEPQADISCNNCKNKQRVFEGKWKSQKRFRTKNYLLK